MTPSSHRLEVVMTIPLGRVRGLGSAKSGTRSYVLKQASGIALGLLTPYMVGLGSIYSVATVNSQFIPSGVFG
jgi:succinate dehydrogenase hydrophobic anchor subunit